MKYIALISVVLFGAQGALIGNSDEQRTSSYWSNPVYDVVYNAPKNDDLLSVLRENSASLTAEYIEKTGLDKALQDGEFTVFAPIDHAYERLPQDVKSYLLAHPSRLRKLLQYHVLPQKLSAQDLQQMDEAMVDTLFSPYQMRVNFYPEYSVTTVSGSLVIHMINIPFRNGVIHIINDIIISIPLYSIRNMLDKCPQAATFHHAAKQSGVYDVFQSSHPHTLFLPTENAFNQLPKRVWQKILNNPSMLRRVIEYHVVPLTYYTQGMYSGEKIRTILGRNVSVHRSPDTGVLRVNGIHALIPDMSMTDGVVHFMEKVLIPPSVTAWLNRRHGHVIEEPTTASQDPHTLEQYLREDPQNINHILRYRDIFPQVQENSARSYVQTYPVSDESAEDNEYEDYEPEQYASYRSESASVEPESEEDRYEEGFYADNRQRSAQVGTNYQSSPIYRYLETQKLRMGGRNMERSMEWED